MGEGHFTVKILDTQGNPIPNVEFHLDRNVAEGEGASNITEGPYKTDENGEKVINIRSPNTIGKEEFIVSYRTRRKTISVDYIQGEEVEEELSVDRINFNHHPDVKVGQTLTVEIHGQNLTNATGIILQHIKDDGNTESIFVNNTDKAIDNNLIIAEFEITEEHFFSSNDQENQGIVLGKYQVVLEKDNTTGYHHIWNSGSINRTIEIIGEGGEDSDEVIINTVEFVPPNTNIGNSINCKIEGINLNNIAKIWLINGDRNNPIFIIPNPFSKEPNLINLEFEIKNSKFVSKLRENNEVAQEGEYHILIKDKDGNMHEHKDVILTVGEGENPLVSSGGQHGKVTLSEESNKKKERIREEIDKIDFDSIILEKDDNTPLLWTSEGKNKRIKHLVYITKKLYAIRNNPTYKEYLDHETNLANYLNRTADFIGHLITAYKNNDKNFLNKYTHRQFNQIILDFLKGIRKLNNSQSDYEHWISYIKQELIRWSFVEKNIKLKGPLKKALINTKKHYKAYLVELHKGRQKRVNQIIQQLNKGEKVKGENRLIEYIKNLARNNSEEFRNYQKDIKKANIPERQELQIKELT